jgi:hypothetical protein
MNMTAFRGRGLRAGQRVFVYRNLHYKCWSVKALDGEFAGKVVAHCDSLGLVNARFVVNEAGRQRVIQQKRKNVHAGIIGEAVFGLDFGGLMPTVRYNPYEAGDFITEVGAAVDSALLVYLGVDGKASAAGIVTRDLLVAA